MLKRMATMWCEARLKTTRCRITIVAPRAVAPWMNYEAPPQIDGARAHSGHLLSVLCCRHRFERE